jgi:hypothetical protein
MKDDVLITHEPIKKIVQDTKQFEVETGGIIVGTLGTPMTIVAAGSSGPNSKHHATQFTSDPVVDGNCLTKARQDYGQAIGPVGWWHKHQAGFDRPSLGDCQQVQQLSRDYHDGKPILMGIVNQRSGLRKKITLRLYSLDPASQLVEHSWKLVSDKHSELLEAIANTPISPETRNTDFWKDQDFQSYLNPIGRQRILREVDELKKAGWIVKTSRHKHNGMLILDMFDGISEFQFILPPEYPLNPPTILTPDGGCFTGSEMLGRWNSNCRLTDLAEEAGCIFACNYCRRRFIKTA